MLKLSKRCKSLVALLLLCGCLVGFSSVSFAADVFSGHRISSNDSTNGVISRVVVSSSDPWVEFETISSISSDTAYTMYRGYIKDYYTVTLENSNDFPTYLASGNEMYLQAYCANPGYGSYFGTDNGFTISIDDTQGCHISSVGIGSGGSPSSQVYFYLDDSHYIDGNLVLLPHETVTVSFTATREYSVHASDNDENLHLEKQLIHDGLQGAYVNSVTLFNEPTSTYTVIGSSSPSVSVSSTSQRYTVPIQDSNGSELGYVRFTGIDSFIRDSSTASAGGTTYETGTAVINCVINTCNNSDNIIAVPQFDGVIGMPKFTFLNLESIPVSDVSFKLVKADFSDPLFYNFSNNNRIYFGVTSPPKTGSAILLDSHSFSTCKLELVFEYSFSHSSLYDSVPFDISTSFSSFYFNDNAPAILATPRTDLFSVDPSTNAITGQLEQQQQQQQQQHEEQMEQSQQQYDDFTDSGSSEGSDLISGTEDDIKEKIGIFTFLDNLIQRFLGLFVASDASTSITLPAFSINIQGRDYQIWDEYTFDLSSLDEPFNALMTAVRFATVATVYFAFLGYLQNTYKRIIGGSNG